MEKTYTEKLSLPASCTLIPAEEMENLGGGYFADSIIGGVTDLAGRIMSKGSDALKFIARSRVVRLGIIAAMVVGCGLILKDNLEDYADAIGINFDSDS